MRMRYSSQPQSLQSAESHYWGVSDPEISFPEEVLDPPRACLQHSENF